MLLGRLMLADAAVQLAEAEVAVDEGSGTRRTSWGAYRTSGNGGAALGLEDLRRGLNCSKGWGRIVEGWCLEFLKGHR